jgi:hypothetical protein
MGALAARGTCIAERQVEVVFFAGIKATAPFRWQLALNVPIKLYRFCPLAPAAVSGSGWALLMMVFASVVM